MLHVLITYFSGTVYLCAIFSLFFVALKKKKFGKVCLYPSFLNFLIHSFVTRVLCCIVINRIENASGTIGE